MHYKIQCLYESRQKVIILLKILLPDYFTDKAMIFVYSYKHYKMNGTFQNNVFCIKFWVARQSTN